MKQLKNQRGLTLVELLAVVVILAIIAAIAAVAIGNVINNSRDKAALSDAIMIVEGAKLANLDQACDETDGKVECTLDQLKPFVDADLTNGAYYGSTTLKGAIAKFDSTIDDKKVNNAESGWQVLATNDIANIKNKKYKPAKDDAKITAGTTYIPERTIKATLKDPKQGEKK